jgi:hypothetical protein
VDEKAIEGTFSDSQIQTNDNEDHKYTRYEKNEQCEWYKTVLAALMTREWFSKYATISRLASSTHYSSMAW